MPRKPYVPKGRSAGRPPLDASERSSSRVAMRLFAEDAWILERVQTDLGRLALEGEEPTSKTDAVVALLRAYDAGRVKLTPGDFVGRRA